VGNYEWREGFLVDKPAARRADPGYFANFAVLIEHRFGSAERGFQLRELLGAAMLLNRDDLECSEELEHCRADHSDDGGRFPFFGMSFGYYL
jgi:hypothetical protein